MPIMDHGPLPESAFFANARDSIPPPRVTTTMATCIVRRRGVTEDIPEDVPEASYEAAENARGRKRRAIGRGRGNVTGAGRAPGRGNGRGIGIASGRGTWSGRARRTGRGHTGGRTGPGAGLWNIMFPPDEARSYVRAEEVPVTQNAPQEEWLDDFQTL